MSTQPPPLPLAPLRQAWVPRVLNVALAAVFLLLMAPIVTNFSGKPTYVQAALVIFSAPVLLLAGLCLSSAIRPGSLGRAVRKARRRRTGSVPSAGSPTQDTPTQDTPTPGA